MKLIYVDSRARVSGTSTNFQISLREPIFVSEGQMMRVDSIRFPMTLVTVTENNRWIYLVETSDPGGWGTPAPPRYSRVQLELGTYSGQELVTHIRARLATVGLAVGVEWLSQSGGMRINYATGTWVEVQLLRDAEVQALPLGTFPSPWLPTDLPRTFSDNLGTPIETHSSGTHVLTFPFVSLRPIDTLYLCSRTLASEDCFGPRGNHDVLAKLVVDDELGAIHRSDMPTNLYHRLPELTLKMLDFSLQDRHGGVVTLAGELSFVLSID